ncbi:Mu-like prophage I protein, partial [Tistlia consotensis]|uniref:phage protease n=1 Tax=Tistlia consotensis TaxID=1321365 RepID=UPI000B6DF629
TPLMPALHAAAAELCARHAVEIPAGAAPEWVHLVPAGRFGGVDGRGPYSLDDAAAVIAASTADGRPLAIDYDHATDLAAPQGRPAPAAGWIEELEAREDGIWGRVTWTPTGAEALQNREYRYLSPVFVHTKAGKVVQLLRAALTNNPNLRQLQALQHSTGDRSTMDMEELLRQLRAALGLPEAADTAAVLQAAKTTTTTAARLPAIAAAAGLAQTASADEIVTAVQASRDPARFVPAEQVTALQSQLNALTTQLAEKEATAAVDAAIQAGKLAPSLRDWGLSLHKRDAAAFADFVAKQPAVIRPGASGPAGDPPPADGGLTAAETALCANLGISPDDFKKSREA